MKVLVVFTGTPGWANGRFKPLTSPNDPVDYSNAAGWLAARLSGRVSAYEVWNEPNQEGFWAGVDPRQVHPRC